MNKKLVVALLTYFSMYKYIKDKKNRSKKRTRRWYARPINSDRKAHGYYQENFKKMKEMNQEEFHKHTRMSINLYNMLLEKLRMSITKPKQRINADERLSITLMFLAHGVNIQCIASRYRLGKSTVRLIILETCEAIWSCLAPSYLSEPNQSQYADIAKDFEEMWDFPNCVGAIDGMHVAVKCPTNTGTMYVNSNKVFSMVLMATCDAKYTFTAVSVGSYGSESDGGIFHVSQFGHALLENKLPLPPNALLPNSSEVLPHVFVADAAFPLGMHIMKPIAPRRHGESLDLKAIVFNYRLSRARRTIENAFGILTARWGILRTTLEFMPAHCETIVLSCLALHNFIMLHDSADYCPPAYVDRDSKDQTIIPGHWRAELDRCGGPLRSVMLHARRGGLSVHDMREKFANFFLNEGAVPFQPAF